MPDLGPVRINGQEYSFRDIRCGTDPRLKPVAGGLTRVRYMSAAEASHFHGVAQAPTGMVPGAYGPTAGLSMRKETWDYVLSLMPRMGYSDFRWDWELSFGRALGGGMKKIKWENFHFLGPTGEHTQGQAIILDIACYVQTIYEDPGDGVYGCPVQPAILVNL